MNNKPLHETHRLVMTDEYFVIGGNPDGLGGGIIGSSRNMYCAVQLKKLAIEQGYKDVKIIEYWDLYKG